MDVLDRIVAPTCKSSVQEKAVSHTHQPHSETKHEEIFAELLSTWYCLVVFGQTMLNFTVQVLSIVLQHVALQRHHPHLDYSPLRIGS